MAAKLVMVAIWWGAATSKLNRHFPYVVAAMMSNSPVWRRKEIKRKFHRDFPDDLRPSRISAFMAHAGTVVEFGAPLFLLLGDGGIVTKVAAVVMICFHLNIISSVPMGVPLEWNVFMILGILTLFVAQAGAHPNDLVHPLPVIAADGGRGRHRGARQPVPGQGLLPARDALLRRQLGHLAVVLPRRPPSTRWTRTWSRRR